MIKRKQKTSLHSIHTYHDIFNRNKFVIKLKIIELIHVQYEDSNNTGKCWRKKYLKYKFNFSGTDVIFAKKTCVKIIEKKCIAI